MLLESFWEVRWNARGVERRKERGGFRGTLKSNDRGPFTRKGE